jgi:hypothetical protein
MPSFRPRERRLLLVTSIVIGCWFVVSWIVVPLSHRAQELEQRVDSQTLTLEALSRLLARQTSIEQHYQAAAGYLAADDPKIAEEMLLSDLQTFAQQVHVQINLKPKPAKREGQVTRVGVEVDLHTSQDKLFTFLDALLGMPKLAQIERLHISGAPGKLGILRAQLLIEQLTLWGQAPFEEN